jgi:AraC-like DNA-binding protein
MALRSSELALDLIAMALGMEELSDDGDPALTRQGALVQRVRYFIADNLPEPSLDPTAIAAAHGVSVRYLNMVLEQQGTSLGRLIQQMRIEACARDLANPDLRERSITTIAYAAGFNDSAHFSRVFRSHFGISPRDFRNHRD